jgi:glycosyltransferase involved in cell wall biosynthesis
MPSVLVMTHSHPRLTRGGAEISAQALFLEMKARGATCWFLGCSGPGSEQRLGAVLTQPFGADDYLYTPSVPFDYFKFANPDPHFAPALEKLIGELKPDIVHAHHYVRFGVEVFAIIKRASPTTRIVVSLHEYLAICNNHGQMVKTANHRLCHRETLMDCAKCFPQFGASDFFLRKRYIQMFFEDVDLFLAPSQFLADRYLAWGLPDAKLAVLENMPPDADMPVKAALSLVPSGKSPAPAAAKPSRPAAKPSATPDILSAHAKRRPVRFGFFGQMSPLKGIEILIEAAQQLETMDAANVTIDIFGDYANQPMDFQTAVIAALKQAGSNVVYHGPYDNADVQRLMARVDAVVVPSIWWENSPVVIQEALISQRPVICSDIGGMAEKVRPGRDGFHFEAGQPSSLSALLAHLAARPEILAKLSDSLKRPIDRPLALDAHLAAYAKLRAAQP